MPYRRIGGGRFDFGDEHHSELSDEDARKIDEAYRRAREREAREGKFGFRSDIREINLYEKKLLYRLKRPLKEFWFRAKIFFSGAKEPLLTYGFIFLILTGLFYYRADVFAFLGGIQAALSETSEGLGSEGGAYSAPPENSWSAYESPSKPPATAPETNLDIGKIEQLVFEKTNSLRDKPLKWSDELASLARGHSEDMAERGYFDHYNPEGQGPTERAKARMIRTITPHGSFRMVGIAENISQTPLGDVIGCGLVYSEEDVASCAVSGWESSPGHYANIVNKDHSEVGIGVARDGKTFYLTADYR